MTKETMKQAIDDVYEVLIKHNMGTSDVALMSYTLLDYIYSELDIYTEEDRAGDSRERVERVSNMILDVHEWDTEEVMSDESDDKETV